MPGAATVPVVRVLRDVERRWGIRRIVVSTYQGASGAGHSGIEELQDGSRTVLQDPQATVPSTRFSPPLAFNVLPGIGEVLEDGSTLQEREVADEVRKVLGAAGHRGHGDLRAGPDGQRARRGGVDTVPFRGGPHRTGGAAPGTAGGRGPRPRRSDPGGAERPGPAPRGADPGLHHRPDGFWVWLATDNLRVGGALDAVRIVEELLARGAL